MFLSKIASHNITNNYQTTLIKKIVSKINFLKLIKKKKLVKNLNILLIIRLLQSNNLLSFSTRSELYSRLKKTPYIVKLLKPSTNLTNSFKKEKPDIVKHIMHINLSYTNTFAYVTDLKGNVIISYSAGVVYLKNKQKIKQPLATISLLKQLVKKLKSTFLCTTTFAVHFINTKEKYELFILRRLEKKIFIKAIRGFNLSPHNGCRPRKLQRIKNKNINFSKMKK